MKAGGLMSAKLDTIGHTGCSLTVECAAGGRAAGVQFPAPRHVPSLLFALAY